MASTERTHSSGTAAKTTPQAAPVESLPMKAPIVVLSDDDDDGLRSHQKDNTASPVVQIVDASVVSEPSSSDKVKTFDSEGSKSAVEKWQQWAIKEIKSKEDGSDSLNGITEVVCNEHFSPNRDTNAAFETWKAKLENLGTKIDKWKRNKKPYAQILYTFNVKFHGIETLSSASGYLEALNTFVEKYYLLCGAVTIDLKRLYEELVKIHGMDLTKVDLQTLEDWSFWKYPDPAQRNDWLAKEHADESFISTKKLLSFGLAGPNSLKHFNRLSLPERPGWIKYFKSYKKWKADKRKGIRVGPEPTSPEAGEAASKKKTEKKEKREVGAPNAPHQRKKLLSQKYKKHSGERETISGDEEGEQERMFHESAANATAAAAATVAIEPSPKDSLMPSPAVRSDTTIPSPQSETQTPQAAVLVDSQSKRRRGLLDDDQTGRKKQKREHEASDAAPLEMPQDDLDEVLNFCAAESQALKNNTVPAEQTVTTSADVHNQDQTIAQLEPAAVPHTVPETDLDFDGIRETKEDGTVVLIDGTEIRIDGTIVNPEIVSSSSSGPTFVGPVFTPQPVPANARPAAPVFIPAANQMNNPVESAQVAYIRAMQQAWQRNEHLRLQFEAEQAAYHQQPQYDPHGQYWSIYSQQMHPASAWVPSQIGVQGQTSDRLMHQPYMQGSMHTGQYVQAGYPVQYGYVGPAQAYGPATSAQLGQMRAAQAAPAQHPAQRGPMRPASTRRPVPQGHVGSVQASRPVQYSQARPSQAVPTYVGPPQPTFMPQPNSNFAR